MNHAPWLKPILRWAFGLICLVVMGQPSPGAAGPPVANFTNIHILPTAFSNYHVGSGGWYQWTAPNHVRVTLSIEQALVQALIGVYTGDSLSSLVEVAHSEVITEYPSDGIYRSVVTFDASPGITYRIAIYATAATFASATLWMSTSATAQDNFSDAKPISGDLPILISYGNVGATKEIGEPNHQLESGGSSVWWSWTPEESVRVVIDTTGSFYGVLIAVYTGANVNSLTRIATGYNSEYLPGRAIFFAQQGITYHIALDGSNGIQGPIELSILKRPDNDSYASANVLAGQLPLEMKGSTYGSTNEPNEPHHGGEIPRSTVWWKWTAPQSGMYSLQNRDPQFDAMLAVYAGETLSALSHLASSSGNGHNTALSFYADAGTTYSIALSGIDGATGLYDLILTRVSSPPPNDDFTNAIEITDTLPFQIVGSNIGATREDADPYLVNGYGEASVWWSWTPNQSGFVTLNTIGSDFDTIVAVFTGVALESLAKIAVNDNISDNSAISELGFIAEAGQTYWIMVAGRSGLGTSGMGNIILNAEVIVGQAPANDHFANATLISSFARTATFYGSNQYASKEPGEPSHGGISGGRSIWWTFVPSRDAHIILSTDGSDFNTLLAVYKGISIDSLEEVASNNDVSWFANYSQIVFPAIAGIQYWVAVDGYLGATGNVVLQYRDTTPPPNDNFSQAQPVVLNHLAPYTMDTTSATNEESEPPHGGRSSSFGSIWYKWSSDRNQQIRISTQGSDFDTLLSVYTGTALSNLQSVAYNDDISPSPPVNKCSQVTFAASDQTDYWIAVARKTVGNGLVQLRITNAEAPPYDNFPGGPPLSLTNQAAILSLSEATLEPGEPSSGPYQFCGELRGSVWTPISVTQSGRYSLLCLLPFGTGLQIFQGSQINNLSTIDQIFNSDVNPEFYPHIFYLNLQEDEQYFVRFYNCNNYPSSFNSIGYVVLAAQPDGDSTILQANSELTAERIVPIPNTNYTAHLTTNILSIYDSGSGDLVRNLTLDMRARLDIMDSGAPGIAIRQSTREVVVYWKTHAVIVDPYSGFKKTVVNPLSDMSYGDLDRATVAYDPLRDRVVFAYVGPRALEDGTRRINSAAVLLGTMEIIQAQPIPVIWNAAQNNNFDLVAIQYLSGPGRVVLIGQGTFGGNFLVRRIDPETRIVTNGTSLSVNPFPGRIIEAPTGGTYFCEEAFGSQRRIRLWNATSLLSIRTLALGNTVSAEYGVGSSMITRQDHQLRFHNSESGIFTAVSAYAPKYEGDRIQSVGLSPDGLACLAHWQWSGLVKMPLSGSSQPDWVRAFSAPGKRAPVRGAISGGRLIVGSDIGSVATANTKELVLGQQATLGEIYEISRMAVLDNGRDAILCLRDRTGQATASLARLDVDSGQLAWMVGEPSPYSGILSVSEQVGLIVCENQASSGTAKVSIRSLATGELVRHIDNLPFDVADAVFDGTGAGLWMLLGNGEIRTYNVSDWSFIVVESGGSYESLSASGSGRYVAAIASGRPFGLAKLDIFDVATKRGVTTIFFSGTADEAVFDVDDDYIFVSSEDIGERNVGRVSKYQIATGEILWTKSLPSDRYHSILLESVVGHVVVLSESSLFTLELRPPRAVIVAGGGNYAGNSIAQQTDDLGAYAYRALRARGYTPENIAYLSAFPNEAAPYRDADGDGLNDVDGFPNLATTSATLNGSFAQGAGRLLVLMIDHGYRTDSFYGFRSSPNTIISSQRLRGWLDDLQSNHPVDVTMVVDSCYSGQLAVDLMSTATQPLPAGRLRTVVASTGTTAVSVFLPPPDLTSFMQSWLASAYMGSSVGAAFQAGADLFDQFPVAGQKPLILSSDGTTSSGQATREFFGASWAYGVQASRDVDTYFPVFESVVPSSSITVGGGSPRLWVRTLSGVEPTTVVATLRPPAPEVLTGDPVTTLPTFLLTRSQSDPREWEVTPPPGTFNLRGVYRMTFTARFNTERVARPAGSSITVSDGPDPDQTVIRAVIGVGNSGHPQTASGLAALATIMTQTYVTRFQDNQGNLNPQWIRYFGTFNTPSLLPQGSSAAALLNEIDGAGGVGRQAGRLYVHLAGESPAPGVLRLADGQLIHAADLDARLDNLQDVLSPGIETVVIVDCPGAGEFVDTLRRTGTQKRVVIGSGRRTDPALFLASPAVSFSGRFLGAALQGVSVYDAMQTARAFFGDFLGSQPGRTASPILDDDGDGVFTFADGALARTLYIGRRLAFADDSASGLPFVLGASLAQSVRPGALSQPFEAYLIEGVDPVRVFAVVVPPGFTGSVVSDLPQFTMERVGATWTWRVVLQAPVVEGDYVVAFFAEYSDGAQFRTSAPAYSLLRSVPDPTDPDRYEGAPWFDSTEAGTNNLTPGESQIHTVHVPDDVDYYGVALSGTDASGAPALVPFALRFEDFAGQAAGVQLRVEVTPLSPAGSPSFFSFSPGAGPGVVTLNATGLRVLRVRVSATGLSPGQGLRYRVNLGDGRAGNNGIVSQTGSSRLNIGWTDLAGGGGASGDGVMRRNATGDWDEWAVYRRSEVALSDGSTVVSEPVLVGGRFWPAQRGCDGIPPALQPGAGPNDVYFELPDEYSGPVGLLNLAGLEYSIHTVKNGVVGPVRIRRSGLLNRSKVDGFDAAFCSTGNTTEVPAGIVVSGNGMAIANGDLTPSTADGTDFGAVFSDGPREQAFVIANTSPDLPLTISSAAFAEGTVEGFQIVQAPSATVAPGATTQMRARFAPTQSGPRQATVVVTSNAAAPNATFQFRIQASGVASGSLTPGLNNPFPSAAGWSPIGQLPPLFTSAFGSRQHDAVNTALAVTVAPNPRGRVIGWVEDPDNDLRYADIGPGNFVRAKFSMFYSGPGDSASATLFNRVPNFRLALRMRGMVQTVLEVNHNPEIAGSPAQAFVTRELGPSKNPAAPSVYRVDLDPVDVPYFTNSTTEGVQRAFEAVMTEPKDYSFVEGTLALTDSSIGTYPALSDAVTPVKTWASGGTAGAADFDNPTVVTGGLSLTVADLLRYLGGPSPADYYNPAVLNAGFDTAPATITRSTAGVTVNTAGLATTRVAAMTANLLGGVFGDTPATRLRVEPGRLYRVSARLFHGGPSDTTPFTRLGVRTAGFGWNQTLELLGARGLPAATGTRPGLAQMLPGAGNQVPGTTGDGTVYNLILGTPLHPQIRADVAGSIAAKFPNLAAQPGPGDPATGAGSPPDGSLRNVNLAFTVIDSLSPASATATDPAEVANNLRLNRVEIRVYPDVVD